MTDGAIPRWKTWIYLPFNAGAWISACAALLVLTILGSAPLRPGNLPPELTTSGVTVTIVASAVLNLILLWRQVNPRYLKPAILRRVFTVTFLALSRPRWWHRRNVAQFREVFTKDVPVRA